jgi:hypothetical protein
MGSRMADVCRARSPALVTGSRSNRRICAFSLAKRRRHSAVSSAFPHSRTNGGSQSCASRRSLRRRFSKSSTLVIKSSSPFALPTPRFFSPRSQVAHVHRRESTSESNLEPSRPVNDEFASKEPNEADQPTVASGSRPMKAAHSLERAIGAPQEQAQPEQIIVALSERCL